MHYQSLLLDYWPRHDWQFLSLLPRFSHFWGFTFLSFKSPNNATRPLMVCYVCINDSRTKKGPRGNWTLSSATKKLNRCEIWRLSVAKDFGATSQPWSTWGERGSCCQWSSRHNSTSEVSCIFHHSQNGSFRSHQIYERLFLSMYYTCWMLYQAKTERKH